jgi:hypothetical protein
MGFFNAKELRESWDDQAHGRRGTLEMLADLLEAGRQGRSGGVKAGDFRFDNLIESLIPDGREFLDDWLRPKGTPMNLAEAAGAVDTSAFSAITGQIMFSAFLEEYESPNLIWKDLVTVQDTPYIYGERIPGVSGLGDTAQSVGEGEEYPEVGVSQQYIDTPPLVKKGNRVSITREAMIADRTGGRILDRCRKSGEWMGVTMEKEVLDVVVGTTNNYKRNGTATNTYLSSGAYINYQASNPLTGEWKAVQNAELLFDAMNDPDTGEPIITSPDTIIVPTALKMDAKRIIAATEIETVDNQANSVTVRTKSANPIGGNIKMLSSPYVKRRSSSATRWWYGQPKKAFRYMQAWDIEQIELGQGSTLQFTRDVLHQFRASKMGKAIVYEPRHMTQNHT